MVAAPCPTTEEVDMFSLSCDCDMNPGLSVRGTTEEDKMISITANIHYKCITLTDRTHLPPPPDTAVDIEDTQ